MLLMQSGRRSEREVVCHGTGTCPCAVSLHAPTEFELFSTFDFDYHRACRAFGQVPLTEDQYHSCRVEIGIFGEGCIEREHAVSCMQI